MISLAVRSGRIRSPWTWGFVVGSASSLISALVATPVYASNELILVPDPGILLVMLVGFVLLVFPMNALIFKPIFHSLDERDARIEGARTRSSQLQQDADAVLDRYESAIREARSESELARQGQLVMAREEQATLTSQARSEAESELATARTALGQSLSEAQASLRASAEDLANAAAEQVLGRALS